MMMKCKDISQLIASGDSENMGVMKRLELRLHLLMCRHCQSYSRQIKALGVGARRLVGAQEPTSEELLHLENAICDRICKHGGGH
jgi:hypothetical protein